MLLIDLVTFYSCSAKVWPNTWIKHTTGKNKTSLETAPIFRVTDQSTWSAIILKIVIFIRFCMVNGQGLPVQLICHTKPYNNRNFQIDGASRYFRAWLWQLVHLLICFCVWLSFIGAVLSVIKAYLHFEQHEICSLFENSRILIISGKGLVCEKPFYILIICILRYSFFSERTF